MMATAMRSPVLFLVAAVGLTLFTFYTAFQTYPRILTSITDVLGFGLMASGVFLLVAIGLVMDAIRTRNAPLRNRDVAELAVGLVFGVFWMLGIFMATG
jgi:hypothetical protein